MTDANVFPQTSNTTDTKYSNGQYLVYPDQEGETDYKINPYSIV